MQKIHSTTKQLSLAEKFKNLTIEAFQKFFQTKDFTFRILLRSLRRERPGFQVRY